MPESISYLQIYFSGSLGFVLYNVFVGILQAVGDSRPPLYYLMASSVINLVLDILFIGFFHTGVGGAALATVIFGTPVYWWGMSAQLKMVVDKFYSQDSQFKTMKKKIGVVVTGANGLDNPQYRLIDEQFRCIAEYLHWDMAFSLAFAAYEPGEVMQQEGILAQLQDACEKIAR